MTAAKRSVMARRHDLDMTEGNVLRLLILFSLPLLAGNIFQQFYNMVDAWVVGNFVSDEAFSAVGSVAPIINTLINFFTGFCSGAGVVISQYFGARNDEKVHDAVHTAIMMTAVMSVALSLIGILLTPMMLRLMKTPADVFPEARSYLVIYFAGLTGLLFYNMGAGILRAVGNSRQPFYFLVAAALMNTALDLLFVLGFHMGVEGVAYATIIAQGTSALLATRTLLKTDSSVRVIPRDIRIHGDILKKIVTVGLPAALQLSITAFSNVFVQSYINQFGKFCMGGWAAYHKLEQLVFLPMQSLSLAATTFVGQNIGKGQFDRAKRGVSTAMHMSMAVTALCAAVLVIFAPLLVSFFNQGTGIIYYGTLFLRNLSPLLVFCCSNQIIAAALRGAGNSRAPMFIMLGSFVVFRQIYMFVVSNFIANELLPLTMGYPAGWILCTVITVTYYRRVGLMGYGLANTRKKKNDTAR